MRQLAGVPIVIHAGYRCPAHNLAVGGVPNSEHTRGLAADVHIPGLNLQQMYDLASEVPQFAEGGIGAYDTSFLHVDVRITGPAEPGFPESTWGFRSWCTNPT